MTLATFLQKVLVVLQKKNVRFALAGGLVASLYRDQKRFTEDLDFLFWVKADALAHAEKTVRSLGLEPSHLTKAQLEGGPLFAIKNKKGPVCIVAGRAPRNSGKMGVDFILPVLPWFDKALRRAQNNRIDFGKPLGHIACLTVEDLVIAKVYAFNNNPTLRLKDFDDLQSIFAAQTAMDLAYLHAELKSYTLRPETKRALKAIFPKALSGLLRQGRAD